MLAVFAKHNLPVWVLKAGEGIGMSSSYIAGCINTRVIEVALLVVSQITEKTTH